jgi:predicted RNase H-like nuclease (RuvC/YqgF family)
MACRICNRSSCTESFHSLEEQELYEKARNIDGNVRQIVDLLRKIESLKAELAEKNGRIEGLKSDIEQYAIEEAGESW